MATRVINTRLQLRSDTAAQWLASNPVLLLGEPGYEKDTHKLKFGDGVTAWNSLPYFSAGGGSTGSYTIEKLSTPETGYAATYVLKDDDNVIHGSKINIPSLSDYYNKSEVDTKLVNKQAKLTAGPNISISTDNVISSTAGAGVIQASITTTFAVGGIAAGKTYATGTPIEQILRDLLVQSTPVGAKYLYYGISQTVPTSVENLTKKVATADDLKANGYIYKNLTLDNAYPLVALDNSLGLTCYEINQGGFALGMLSTNLGDQTLYYPDTPMTDTGARLTYKFEEA